MCRVLINIYAGVAHVCLKTRIEMTNLTKSLYSDVLAPLSSVDICARAPLGVSTTPAHPNAGLGSEKNTGRK